MATKGMSREELVDELEQNKARRYKEYDVCPYHRISSSSLVSQYCRLNLTEFLIHVKCLLPPPSSQQFGK